MKPIITLNQTIKTFICNCLSSDSLAEFKEKLGYTKLNTGENFQYDNKHYDVYYCSLKKGKAYLSFIETEQNIIILGYHLNNDDIDENNNFIFIDGSESKHIAKVNILVNNEVKI